MDILTTVITAIGLFTKFAPTAVESAKKLYDFGSALYNNLAGTGLTKEQSAELEKKCDEMFERFMTPLPPAQPGDPDYVEPSGDSA